MIPFQTFQSATQKAIFPYDGDALRLASYNCMQATMMIIEEEGKPKSSKFDPDVKPPQPLETKSSEEKKDHSKHCLTFCRKISGIMISLLTNKSLLVEEIIRINSEALTTLPPLLDLPQINVADLEDLQTQVLSKIWNEFKDLMTYRKNKKICVVKQSYWDLVFNKTVFGETCHKLFEQVIESTKNPSIQILLRDQIFRTLLIRLLFCSNKIMVLLSILKDTSERGMDIRKITTLDNFIVLVIFPDHFRNYNHRGGKFALECCDKCKICCSKKVPPGFSALLRESRNQTEAIISKIQVFLDGYKFKELASVVGLMELAVNCF